MPVEGRENLIVLLATVNLPLNADGATTLYTAPSGKRFLPDHVKIEAGADAGTTQVTFGGNSTAYNDFLAAQTLSNLDAQYDMVKLMPVPNATPVKQKTYSSSTPFKANVSNQAGGATNKCMVFGTLYTV